MSAVSAEIQISCVCLLFPLLQLETPHYVSSVMFTIFSVIVSLNDVDPSRKVDVGEVPVLCY